jgi:DNA-binding NarL/FixJ family response regulator
MRVLLVEDDKRLQLDLAQAIAAMADGEIVKITDTSGSAIKWLDENPYGWDLAIVDMFLAEGHGFDVLRQCRKSLPHQRAVMLSNYGHPPVADYAKQAGADRFFDKSFDLEALVEYCESLSKDLERH